MDERPPGDDEQSPTTPPAPAGGFSWGLTPAEGAPSAPADKTTPPPLIEPEVAPRPDDAPPWDLPTQMMDAVPAPTEPPVAPPPAPAAPPPAPPPSDPVAAEVAATELLGAAATAGDPATASALEALFSEEHFRDYQAGAAAAPPPAGPAASAAAVAPQPPRAGVTRTQKILLGVAGGLVVLLALVALFLLGTRLPALIGPEPTPTPSATPTPTPTPTPTALPVGPVAPGEHAWDELLGGECLDPFTDPWAEDFTVVDCAQPHPAQMVYRGVFPPSAEGVTDDPFPGTAALQGQMSLLCTAPGVVDLGAAGQFSDVQFQGTYPATQEQWDAGDRSYYCFVSRSSGEPLTGSVAVAPAPPAA